MIRTKIRFVRGFEPAFAVPKPAKVAGLEHRFAVIQETYRPDQVDMYFDEALWRRLLAFAMQFAPGLSVGISQPRDTNEIQPEDFLAAWNLGAREDREPPAITVRESGKLVLYIDPEYWVSVGGPMPYHDSYTNSIYANEDLSARVMRFLAEADAVAGWDLSADILPPSTRKSFWKVWLKR
jgi:hypothetical protein